MRALYLPFEEKTQGSEIEIKGEAWHHLANVVRVKSGEELLLLNGQGTKLRTRITLIEKSRLFCNVEKCEEAAPPAAVDVLIFIPKKEALESMLKMGTELGVGKIYLWRGEYSVERLPPAERLDAVVKSALEQSNNPWLPVVKTLESWPDFGAEKYQHVVLFDASQDSEKTVRNTGQKTLLIFGAEGGVSVAEREKILSHAYAYCQRLPTPILRAPTALAAGVGWWLGRA